MNPNSIKLYASSDDKRRIYSHLPSCCSGVGNTECTFALMKLAGAGDLWRSIKSQMKSANAETDVLAALISTVI